MAVKDVKFVLSFDDKGTAILKKATKDGVKTLGQFSGKAKDAEKALIGLTKGASSSGKGMGKLKGMLKSTWGQMAMGMGVMTGVTGLFRSVSRAITSTIQVGREFQASWANTTTMMSTTGQIIDDTGQSLSDMKTELINMSPVLGGAKGLSEGLYQVLSASVPVADSLDFLATASKSAVAGVTDISTSVDALTTVYNAYGAEAYSVENISDIMFQTIKRGKLTYETLAGALGTVVPIASQVGVQFEEVAGAMATMTRQGIDVNTATVALRQTLVSVLKPTKDATETAERLGIGFDSATLKAMGFADWLTMVSEKAGGSVDDMTALFGNVRALMGVFALAGDKIEEFTDDVDLMRDAVVNGNVTHEAFVKQLQNADAMLRTLKTILDKMKLAIWEGVVKPFQEAILNTDDVVKSMEELQKKAIEFGTKLGESIGKVIKALVDFRKVVVTVVKVLATFWALKKVNAWATGMSTALVKVAGRFKVFSGAVAGQGPMMLKAFKVIKVGVMGLGKVLAGLVTSTGPVGLVIAGVVALGAGAYMLIKHWDKVKEFFVKLWTNIRAVFAGALNAISGMLPDWAKKVLNVLIWPYKQMLKLFGGYIKRIVIIATGLGKAIWTALKWYGEKLFGFWKGVFNKIKDAVTKVVNWIKKLQFWKKFKDDFKEGFDYVKNEAKATTAVVSEETKKWAKHFLESGEASKLASKMFGGIIDLAKKLKPNTKEVVASLDAQTKALLNMVNTGKIGYVDAVSRIEELMGAYKKAGQDIPQSLYDVADALDANQAKIRESKEAYKELLDEYRKLMPTTKDIGTQTQALTQVIDGYIAQGADATEATKLFEKQITSLYTSAEAIKKMFGTEIPPALENLNKRLSSSGGKVAVLKTNIKGLSDILKQAVGKTFKDLERGFMGIDTEGQKVWMSMSKVQAIAKALGVTFKQDLKKQLAYLEEGFNNVMTTGDVLEKDQARMITDILALYEQLGIEAPEKYEDMMDELIKRTKKGRGNILVEMEKLGQLIGILGEQVGGAFGEIITTVGIGIQQAVQAVANGVKGLGEVLGSISPMLGQLGGQIGGFISKTKDNFSQLGSSIGATIGGIFGPLGKAIGALAGGLLGGLFGKKKPKKTEEQRLLEQFNAQVEEAKVAMKEFGDISDDTARAIAESRKEYAGWVAEALNMSKVMQDVGIDQTNINALWGKAHGLISAYEQGLVDTVTASEELGRQFGLLVEGARDMGLEGSRAMTEFINHVRASGLEVAEVTNYINDQLGLVPKSAMNASEGLLAMADMLPIERFQKWSDKQKDILEQMDLIGDKGSDAYKALQDELDGVNEKMENATKNATKQLQNLESQTLAVFNAMIANGASYSEAMTAIGPTLDQIILAQEEMGIEAGTAIQELLRIREVEQAHKGLWLAIDGNLAVLNALASTGSLTQEAMMDAGQKAKNYYKNLMKAGLDSNQALAQMAPTLQQLKYYAEEHGLAIDKGTQALIDQAEEAGLLDEQQMSATDVMLAGFGLMIQALGADIPEAMQESIDKMNELEHAVHGSGVTGAMEILATVTEDTFSDMASGAEKLVDDFGTMAGGVYDIQTALDSLEAPELTVDVDYSAPDEGTGGGGGKRKGAQGGYDGLIREPTQPFLAHKGEYVKVWRKDEVDRGEHKGGAGAGNVIVQIEPLIIPREHETVVNFVVKKIERGEVRVPPGQVR